MPKSDIIDEKLYVYVVCSICKASRTKCPYCDNGKTYIESTFENIKIQLTKLSKEDKMILIEFLKNSNGEK